MHLDELIDVLRFEAQSSREDLAVNSACLTTLEIDEDNLLLLEESAASYADFCGRVASAAESLGLCGIASAASAIAQGLAMACSLPLEMRQSAAALLDGWPDFFISYLDAWRTGNTDEAQVMGLLANMAAAEFVTPLDETQLTELGTLLMAPPLVADQQAALLPGFEPPTLEAMSLDIPADAEPEVVDGFLAEGPSQVEQITGVVAALKGGMVPAAQLELAHRSAHTLKGTAAIAGVRGIATLAHALEDVMEAFRRDDFKPPAGLHQVMTTACEQLELALDHLTHTSGVPEEFEAVTCRLHAWACHLQGIEVPHEALYGEIVSRLNEEDERDQEDEKAAAPHAGVADEAIVPSVLPSRRLTDLVPAAVVAEGDTAAERASPAIETQADEDLQVRISAKALDKIFRAVNELAIGLLRLRTQSDDVLARTNALSVLDQVATQRLAEIERRVTLEGLGRAGRPGGAGAAGPAMGGAVTVEPASAGFDVIEMDRYNELTGATQALNEAFADLRGAREGLMPSMRDVNTLTQRQLDIARESQYQIAQARLRPLSGLRSRMRRTVRQTCTAVGRDARLEISGDELRVDAAVLGPLSEALLHLLRNSVDHGIEPPQERLAAGKAAQGLIQVTFTSQGGGVVIKITDDGKGLDYEAILDKAIWSGLVSPDATLSKEEVGRLIFLPGFSVRNTVTETSGRGVGLDAVVQALSLLQGHVSVSSQAGAGTEFRLYALASIGTVHALHLEVEGEHFLVPSIQLERVDAAPLSHGLPAAGAAVEAMPDSPAAAEVKAPDIPTVWLPHLLHGSRRLADRTGADADSSRPALVVNIDGHLRRITVDRIIEAREFLISPVPTLIDRMPGMTGVATLADGTLGMVLDLIDLSRKPLPVQAQGLREMRASVQEQAHVLVVDDSASVRNTISALLRDENYRITTARDGLEAMRAMLDNRFSLVLTDLEMPQLNGFELTEFIRNRSSQPQVPVVMLTSRGQDKHRARAAEVGVDSFLVKPYSDQQLLETVRTAVTAGDRRAVPAKPERPALFSAPAKITERSLS